jgi:hypothetical protein
MFEDATLGLFPVLFFTIFTQNRPFSANIDPLNNALKPSLL